MHEFVSGGASARINEVPAMKSSIAKSGAAKRGHPRVGRPPKNLAGDVEARILDAAEQVFLEKGYSSASIDEIALLAPASKPTIYAHFADKQSPFSTVVVRIINRLTDFAGHAPEGRSVQDKLASLGTQIVDRAIDDLIGVARAAIAEAPRFPDLSRRLHAAARDRAAGAVAQLLGDATHLSRGTKGPFGAKRSVATAQIFMDLILLPMLMRSLMGDEAKELRKELPSFVRERVNFFLAACEADWKR
jgi:AcrR family transcriptional regulator